VLDLNRMARISAEIADKRGQGTDELGALKHCAGEVVEAMEAFSDIPHKFDDKRFKGELADIIMCVFTVCGANGYDVEQMLTDCLSKNLKRVNELEGIDG